jgi:DNA invertase Pin-like site-specific DNA recombinase
LWFLPVLSAEFEAAMIRERVRSGVARAKRNGTKSGRAIGRPKLDAKREAAVRRALQNGGGILKTAKALSVGTGRYSCPNCKRNANID